MRTSKPVILIDKLEKINKKSLLSNGYYCINDGYEVDTIYIKKFPLYKYKRYPVLYGEIKINSSSKNIVYEMTDQNGQLYAPFYNPDMHPAHRSFLNKLLRILNAEIKNLDARPSNKRTTRKS